MAGIKKIFVSKTDEATLVVEKLIDAEASEVVISVPKFSTFAESLANFHLLKREAEVLGKQITVESVDDKVIELCEASRIASVNPFFSRQRQFADIVRRDAAAVAKETAARKAVPNGKQRKGAAPREANAAAPPALEQIRPRGVLARTGRRFRFLLSRRAVLVALPTLALGIAAAFTLLPKANITITAVTREWTYEGTVTAEKSVAAPQAAGLTIPGQIFRERKNMDLSFPASGRKAVTRKARGTITIWNKFSSAPQTLVAGTRFAAPDGKIFRLAKAVTVPGAKVGNGKIEPTSIQADVVADAAGAGYNIGPVEQFTIPGFGGTPKFSGFYGSSREAMSGGLAGETAYPTDEDIRKARETATATLENTVKTFLLAQLPRDLRFFERGAQFSIVKQIVNPEADAEGKFSVFTEGELSVVAFREEDVRALLAARLRSESGADMEVRSDALTYDEGAVARERDALRIPIRYTSTIARAIDREAVEREVAGKSERELRAFIFSLPGLASARISLWPFWVRRVSNNPARVQVTVE